MAQVKPFEIPWTPVHNYVFDEIMPKLSPNAWKVLCVAMRQTLGWAGNGPGGRKEWDTISYSQFMQKTGIGSRHTISRALEECCEADFLLRRQVGHHPGTDKPIYAYALNTDYSIEAASAENAPAPSAKTAPAASAETALTKQRETNTKESDDVPPTAQSLMALGVHRSEAVRLAKTRPPELIQGWCAYLRRDGHRLENPAGFLVAKIRNGESPPLSDTYQDNRRRYLAEGTPYEGLVEH